jgi:hypothetical protein
MSAGQTGLNINWGSTYENKKKPQAVPLSRTIHWPAGSIFRTSGFA